MTDDNDKTNENTEILQDEYALVKHSVKHKQRERKIRKKRKKLNRIKAFSRFILFVLLIFASYKFFKLPQWYLPQDTFSKADGRVIEVLNNNIVPTPVIYDVLKNLYVPKLPIFFVKVNPIKHELFKIPVIKSIYIRRYGFPARIQIIIRERVPVAVIKTDLKSKPIAFFTSDGILISSKKYMNLAETKSALKILTKDTQINKNWSAKKVRGIEKIVKSVETYSGEKVEYIDMRKPQDVYIKIQTTSIRLGVLDNTVFERIKRIYTILPQIDEMGNRIKYIDLSWDKVNYLKLKKAK